MITGLQYISDFISREEESELISTIDSQEWNTELKRRTQHYGYKYDYFKKNVDSSLYLGPVPSFLQPYLDRLVEKNIFKELPDQVIVNEYTPGQGISRHVDCVTCFKDTIASLSLNSTCCMEFESLKDNKKGSMMLDSKSLLVLSAEARYDWMHSIPARREDEYAGTTFKRDRRISLTFRNVLNDRYERIH